MAVVRGRTNKFHRPYPDVAQPKRSAEPLASHDATQLQALRDNPLLYDPLARHVARPQDAAGAAERAGV